MRFKIYFIYIKLYRYENEFASFFVLAHHEKLLSWRQGFYGISNTDFFCKFSQNEVIFVKLENLSIFAI